MLVARGQSGAFTMASALDLRAQLKEAEEALRKAQAARDTATEEVRARGRRLRRGSQVFACSAFLFTDNYVVLGRAQIVCYPRHLCALA